MKILRNTFFIGEIEEYVPRACVLTRLKPIFGLSSPKGQAHF